MRWRRPVLLGILAALAAIQVIPWRRPTNPIAGAEPLWDTTRTRELFVRACADCHSNETEWPWYSRVAPVSWYVVHHVEAGREALNVSRWSSEMAHAGKEAGDEIQRCTMPLKWYLFLHSEARLAETDKRALATGLEATFQSAPHDDPTPY
jgi:mono/diheme cytochrome c family protein